jgi:hypothetical protein
MSMVTNQDLRTIEKSGAGGFVAIEILERDKRGGLKVISNQVTHLGSRVMQVPSAAAMITMPSGRGRGSWHRSSSFGKFDSSQAINYLAPDDGLNLYLINNPAVVLNAKSKHVPIFDANWLVDPTKIIGYASFKPAGGGAKEGKPAPLLEELFADDTVAGQTWIFDETQANGTFEKICTGAGLLANRFNGATVSRGIENSDVSSAGGETPRTVYGMPGITGVTAANEVLLAQGGELSTHVLNLETGVTTTLATGDVRKGLQLAPAHINQFVFNNKWYRKVGSYVQATDLTTMSTTLVFSNSSSYETLFLYNNLIYVSDGATKYIAYDPATYAAVPASDLVLANLLPPAEFNTSTMYVIIGNSGANFVVCDKVKNIGIECTNILNMKGSIVDLRPYVQSAAMYTIGTVKNTFLGNSFSDLGYPVVAGVTANSSYQVSGVKVAKDHDIGSLISYIQLSAAITKANTQIMRISYGFRFQ